jgi:hypothetical protein
MNNNLFLDEEYVFGSSKTNYRYVFLINQGLVVKRTLDGAITASKILISNKGVRKYFKCLFLWISIYLFPIYKFSQFIYLNNSSIDVAFFGRSKRVKIFKKNLIINKVNDDFFSRTDYYMRKKIHKANITPKVFVFGNSFFSEEIIKNFTYADDINIVKDELNTFKSYFKTLYLDKDYYFQKLLHKIERLNPKIVEKINFLTCSEKGMVKIRMSHGDLVKRNILLKKNKEPLLIDYEFSGYRSDFYDELFETYYEDRFSFFKQKPNFKICVFLLERIFLMLKLEQELKVPYINEIDKACYYLIKNYNIKKSL